MKTKDIIDSGYLSFNSLIKVIRKPIVFDDIEDHQYKGVLEGRYEAFVIAGSQLNQIKDLEDQANLFSADRYNSNIKTLIESTDDILKEINKILKKDIVVDAIDEEKFKAVVQAKKVAFNFLVEIKNRKNDMQSILKNSTAKIITTRNLATDRVKKG